MSTDWQKVVKDGSVQKLKISELKVTRIKSAAFIGRECDSWIGFCSHSDRCPGLPEVE